MDDKKILGLMGLAARARKICFGADSVALEIKKGKVQLLILAIDASERTREKFTKLSEEYKVPVIREGKIEVLSKAIGRSNKAVIGIEDHNLAREIQKIKNGGELIG